MTAPSPPGDDGFLGRWSRRKLAQAKGQPLAEPARPVVPQALEEKTAAPPVSQAEVATKEVASGPSSAAAPAQTPSALTLADVAQLPSGSDISRFVAQGVAPEVRNAAFKKLFADPHFNVMDRLDTYIDDYHTPNPLPAAVVRQLAATDFLGWNRPTEEAAPANASATTVPAHSSPQPAVAQPAGEASSYDAPAPNASLASPEVAPDPTSAPVHAPIAPPLHEPPAAL
jgi:hypothetical protein